MGSCVLPIVAIGDAAGVAMPVDTPYSPSLPTTLPTAREILKACKTRPRSNRPPEPGVAAFAGSFSGVLCTCFYMQCNAIANIYIC